MKQRFHYIFSSHIYRTGRLSSNHRQFELILDVMTSPKVWYSHPVKNANSFLKKAASPPSPGAQKVAGIYIGILIVACLLTGENWSIFLMSWRHQRSDTATLWKKTNSFWNSWPIYIVLWPVNAVPCSPTVDFIVHFCSSLPQKVLFCGQSSLFLVFQPQISLSNFFHLYLRKVFPRPFFSSWDSYILLFNFLMRYT